MRKIAFVLLLSLQLASCNAPKEKAVTKSDPFKCIGLPVCAEEVRKLAQAEAALKTEYEGAVESIRSCMPANSTRCYNLPHAIELIEAEQRTWLAWRNAHCDVFVFGMEDTSAEGELRADCRNRETSKRTAELKQIRNN